MATEVSSSSAPTKTLSPPLKKPKKTMTTTRTAEDIVVYSILPRLPFKSLCRFKSVCKKWNYIVSGNDPLFAKLQSLCCGSASISRAAATVSLNNHGHIAFLPTLATSPADIPAPTPISSILIGDDDGDIRVTKILACTNGLLCLLCYRNLERFLYLCNPATKEAGHRIPVPSSFSMDDSIGLAFDPSKSKSEKDCGYTLVHPMRSNASRINGAEYRFMVLPSQDRGRGWTESEQVVLSVENQLWKESKPVFANGFLYWNCTDYLLWFRCCENEPASAGYILMPRQSSSFVEQEVGVCGDRVTFTRLSCESLDVWVLLQDNVGRSKRWEQIYGVCLERMVQGNTHVFSPLCCGTARLRSRKKISDGLVFRYQMFPLPFEGGDKVLFRVMPRRNSKKLETKVLSFDMTSGKMTEVFRGELFKDGSLSFGYIKSLACLP